MSEYEINLDEDKRGLLAFELYKSVTEAEETLNEVQELGLEDELAADEEAASVEEIQEYISERKELLKDLEMPYYKLRISAKINYEGDFFNTTNSNGEDNE